MSYIFEEGSINSAFRIPYTIHIILYAWLFYFVLNLKKVCYLIFRHTFVESILHSSILGLMKASSAYQQFIIIHYIRRHQQMCHNCSFTTTGFAYNNHTYIWR